MDLRSLCSRAPALRCGVNKRGVFAFGESAVAGSNLACYSRGDCPNLGPSVVVVPYVATFLYPPDPHILRSFALTVWRGRAPNIMELRALNAAPSEAKFSKSPSIHRVVVLFYPMTLKSRSDSVAATYWSIQLHANSVRSTGLIASTPIA